MIKRLTRTPALETVPASRFSRRVVVKGCVAAAAGLSAPFHVKNALSSSGEVSLMGWAGFPDLSARAFPAFEKATGIRVNFTEQPDQASMFAQAKISRQTVAFDMVEPTLNRIAGWASDGLVQGWDTSKLSMDNYLPGIADGSAGERATFNGKRMIVPSVWGTEAILYSVRDAPTEYGKASLGDLWDDKFVGKVCLRAISSLPAMGRWLESQGRLPRPWLESYANEDAMRRLWDIALAEAIKHKANIAQFWNGENDAQAAFLANGALLGLNWDSTGYNLRDHGFGFVAPKEGAFAWNQGFVLLANAKNVEQAHQLAKWVSTAEGSAAWASAFSANPVGKGGIELTSAHVKTFYAMAYPGDALRKLWWWPAQEPWFTRLLGEYSDKYKAA